MRSSSAHAIDQAAYLPPEGAVTGSTTAGSFQTIIVALKIRQCKTISKIIRMILTVVVALPLSAVTDVAASKRVLKTFMMAT